MPSTSDVSLPAGFIRSLSGASTQEQMLRAAADWLPRLIETERASITLPVDASHLELYAFGGTAEVIRSDLRIPIATSMIGQAFRQRRLVAAENIVHSSFEDVVTASSKAHTILKVLASMCQELGIAALAEGIEHEDEMVACREFGIDYGQGWHLGGPKPLEELIEILQSEPVGSSVVESAATSTIR